MIDISNWMDHFLQILTDTFGQRLWFVGLQGSYGRGEATEESDIDTVVILDELTPADITRYNAMLNTLPNRQLLCGFLSGKQELLHWEPADLFQFYHDTTPILGSLEDLLPLLDEAAVDRAIRIGAGNLYHGCVHNMLYEKSEDILRGLYKSAGFVVQAVCFRQTGRFTRSQTRLAEIAAPEERRILDTALLLKRGGEVDFEAMSNALFVWTKTWINATK